MASRPCRSAGNGLESSSATMTGKNISQGLTMTDDEKMERNMRFIVEQQAQFAADIQQIREIQAQSAAQFATDMQQVREVLNAQSQAMVTMLSMIGKLGETQAAHDARIATLETKMTELAEAGKETEGRLNTFIVFVEKYIGSRDGGAEKAREN